MALGFYPGESFSIPLLLLATAISSFGLVLGEMGNAAGRLRRNASPCAALGLFAGTVVAWYEAGYVEVGRPMPTSELSFYPAWAEGRLS